MRGLGGSQIQRPCALVREVTIARHKVLFIREEKRVGTWATTNGFRRMNSDEWAMQNGDTLVLRNPPHSKGSKEETFFSDHLEAQVFGEEALVLGLPENDGVFVI